MFDLSDQVNNVLMALRFPQFNDGHTVKTLVTENSLQTLSNKIISNPQFIHGRIDDYYKAEKIALGDMKGSKANTADCIISTHSASEIINALKNKEKITSDISKGFVNLGSIKYIQVSLKISKDGAQLGKIAKFLGHKGITITPDQAVKDLKISEGAIWDKIKNFAGGIWDKLKKTVSSLMGGFKTKYISIFKKGPSESDINDLAKEMGIKESVILEGTMNNKTKAIIESVKNNPLPIINSIDTQLREAIRISESSPLILGMWEKMKSFNKLSDDSEALALIGNYCAAKTIVNMTKDSTKIFCGEKFSIQFV
jgi:hypothetical protein